MATYIDRDYGVAFELPVTAAELVLHLHGGAIYVFRHYCTFLVCFADVIGFFYLARSGLLTGKLDYWVRYCYCHCLSV